MQGKDNLHKVEVPEHYEVAFSGHLVRAGAAGTSQGGCSYRLHIYFGDDQPDDETDPFVSQMAGHREHIASMEQRFTLINPATSLQPST
jgi:hypothetical protein